MSAGSGGAEAVEGCVGRVVGWCWALSGTTPSVSPPRQGQQHSSWVMPKQHLPSVGALRQTGGIMKPAVWMRHAGVSSESRRALLTLGQVEENKVSSR